MGEKLYDSLMNDERSGRSGPDDITGLLASHCPMDGYRGPGSLLCSRQSDAEVVVAEVTTIGAARDRIMDLEEPIEPRECHHSALVDARPAA
jgi:hypothetical protein